VQRNRWTGFGKTDQTARLEIDSFGLQRVSRFVQLLPLWQIVTNGEPLEFFWGLK
jgi:hypothetical protein